MRMVSQVPRQARILLVDDRVENLIALDAILAPLDQILVSRLRPDSTRIQLRSAFADSSGHVTLNLALQEEDEITIFSKTTFRPERYVIVSGAVRSPGRLRFREGMTVRDAILLADGLREDAFLKEAEIARVPEDRSRGAVSTTIRVPLDSTYLFARGQANEYPGMPGVPGMPGMAGVPPVQGPPAMINPPMIGSPSRNLASRAGSAVGVRGPDRASGASAW